MIFLFHLQPNIKREDIYIMVDNNSKSPTEEVQLLKSYRATWVQEL